MAGSVGWFTLPSQNQKSNHSGMRLEDLGLEAGFAHGVADMCSLNSLLWLRISAFLFLSFVLSVSFWVNAGDSCVFCNTNFVEGLKQVFRISNYISQVSGCVHWHSGWRLRVTTAWSVGGAPSWCKYWILRQIGIFSSRHSGETVRTCHSCDLKKYLKLSYALRLLSQTFCLILSSISVEYGRALLEICVVSRRPRVCDEIYIHK